MSKVETFQEAEKIENIKYTSTIGSSLSEWYDGVRNKKFKEFTIGDLCRSIRQNLFIYYLISYIVMTLKEDPFAGEVYDGELIVSLKSIDLNFWKNHPSEGKAIRSVIEQNMDELDEDVRSDAVELLNKLS